MFLFKTTTLLAFGLLVTLTACGGGGGDSGDEDIIPLNKAYFIDSGVEGLDYRSNSHQGVTGSNGDFLYEPGETTTFSYFGLQLGSVFTPANSSAFTPLDIFATDDVNNQSVKNLLVLLQTLDTDQNPANGISLFPAISGISINLDSLDIASSNFQSQLIPALGDQLGNTIVLVSEQDAIDHFNETLITLNAITILDGRWLMRDATHGDVGAVYTFSDNKQLAVTEFDDCLFNDTYWAANEGSAERNCTEVLLTFSWSLDNNILTMSSENISDSCSIISSTLNFIEASCVFQGSDLGTELTRFERDITELNDRVINARYRQIGINTLEYANVFFNSDFSGLSDFMNEGGFFQSQESFDWTVSASQLSLSGRGGDPVFSETFNFVEAVRGAFSADDRSRVLIPDFDAGLAENLINGQTYGVYDAINGHCNKIYNFNPLFSDNVIPLRKTGNLSNNADECEIPAEGLVLPDLSDSADYSVTISNGALVIEQGDEREICWPVAFSTLSEDGDFAVVACSSDISVFAFEIWRQI